MQTKYAEPIKSFKYNDFPNGETSGILAQISNHLKKYHIIDIKEVPKEMVLMIRMEKNCTCRCTDAEEFLGNIRLTEYPWLNKKSFYHTKPWMGPTQKLFGGWLLT